MNSCKGCLAEFLLACVMGAVALAFAWAVQTQDLAQFGTVQHLASDGTVKENPVCLFGMIGIVAVFIVVAAAMLRRSERKVIEAGDVAEQHGGDPIAPVTKAARSGCASGFALLALLAVCGVLAWIFSVVGGL